MNIGIQIKHFRTKRGITQDALARELNVTAQTVSKWETGTTAPDISILPQIATFFGVRIDDLFALNPADKLERLENKIYSAATLEPSVFSAVKNELTDISDSGEYAAKANALLAELYLHQSEGYADIAKEYAKKALAAAPDDTSSLSTLANAMHTYIPDWNARNHHELIDYLKEFLKRNPDSRAACMWLLDNLIDDGRLREAEVWLEHLQNTDNSFRPLIYKRILSGRRGDKQAEECTLRELKAMDGDWLVCMCLGDIFAEKEDYAAAREYYEKAIELQAVPRYTDAPASVAHICEITGDIDGAKNAYRKVLDILTENGIVSGDSVDYYREKLALLK